MRICVAILCVVLLAGCGKVGPAAAVAPLIPTPIPAVTHLPALAAVSRGSPTSDQGRAAAPLIAPSPSAASAVASARARGGLVYVAIGASETVGVGASDPSRDGWVPQLAQLLGPRTLVRNLGVSGTLLSTATKDQLPVAVQEQPDLVTVWLAVNDLNAHVPLERYSADLDTLLASLARQTPARVLVGNVPDLPRVPAYQAVDPVSLRAELERWNTVIAEVAGRHGAVVVDLYAGYAEVGSHPEYISADGFHPSTAGYARLGEMFYEAARLVLPE
jgi:acyl-CoA thioesterase I